MFIILHKVMSFYKTLSTCIYRSSTFINGLQNVRMWQKPFITHVCSERNIFKHRFCQGRLLD